MTKTLNIENYLEQPLPELIPLANKIRKENLGTKFEVCSIMNAKSGLCSEDCQFCAQSSRHNAEVSVYPLKEKEEIIEAARRAKEIDAQKFGIVTSGNHLTAKELDLIAEAIDEIVRTVDIKVCASLGALDKHELQTLKEAKLSRYHHNLETSPSFYPKIVTTHDFSQRVKTVEAAKEAGLEVCSGGIIGMGESWEDRLEMARWLEKLEVDAVPLNFLVPIPKTPLASINRISFLEAVKTIAIFRIILEDKIIKIAAGRETILKDHQIMGFKAGANGMLIGGYLTIKGRDLEEDNLLIKEIQREIGRAHV